MSDDKSLAGMMIPFAVIVIVLSLAITGAITTCETNASLQARRDDAAACITACGEGNVKLLEYSWNGRPHCECFDIGVDVD